MTTVTNNNGSADRCRGLSEVPSSLCSRPAQGPGQTARHSETITIVKRTIVTIVTIVTITIVTIVTITIVTIVTITIVTITIVTITILTIVTITIVKRTISDTSDNNKQ